MVTKRGCPYHPDAAMQLKPPEEPYICSGCREVGFESSYHCGNSNCSYTLHEECAKADSLAFHPFFPKIYFELHEKAPGDRQRYCDGCGKDVLGFVYHCSSKGYDLHPCCLKLKRRICDEEGLVTLELSQKVPSKCNKCKHRSVVKGVKGWSYVSSGSRENYCYHVSCVKELILENYNYHYFSQVSLRNMEIVPSGRSSRRLGRMKKYTKLAVLMFKLVFSAIFGNPISAIVALVEALA